MTSLTLRRTFLAALFVGASAFTLAPTSALAYDESSPAALNVDAQGVAVKGYDLVAYFTDGAAAPGNARFSATHGGATYWFASAAHRDAFQSHPARYLPQFGGFCAMGVALDRKLDGDPNAWRVVDGKLYLNVNKDVQKKWLEDVPAHIQKANASWPAIKNKAPKDL